MKYIIHLLFFVSFISFSQEEREDHLTPVIASFNGMHCDGKHGLCEIIIPNEEKGEIGNAQLSNNEEILKLVIYRDKLSNEEEYKVLGKNINKFIKENESTYMLGYSFELDNSITKSLNLQDETYIIEKGSYPLQITSEVFIITFKLK